MTNNTDEEALLPVTPDRGLAQFFFEMGFSACYAEVTVQNGNKVPFPLTDAEIERQWAISRDAYDDADELEAMLSLARSQSQSLSATQEDAERSGVGGERVCSACDGESRGCTSEYRCLRCEGTGIEPDFVDGLDNRPKADDAAVARAALSTDKGEASRG